MAILYMDGFDAYTDIDEMLEDDRYSIENASGTNRPTFVTGRNGSGQALKFNNGEEDYFFRLNAASNATIIVGFAIKIDNFISTQFIEFIPPDQASAYTWRIFIVSTDKSIQLYGGSSLGVSTGSLNLGQWYYIEAKVLMSNGSGTAELKVDGVVVDSATGLDTITTGSTASVDKMVVNGSIILNVSIDDFYVADTSGSGLTDYAGDVKIEQLLPDGAGSSTQFTPLSGSNFQNVDDAQSDGDTSYNSSSTTGHKDLFTCGNLSSSADTIYAVQIFNKFKKDDVGARTLRGKILSNVTEGNGATVGSDASFYNAHSDIFEVDPDTSSAWTESGVNAVEIGYEIVS